jgi:hypothetical protein
MTALQIETYGCDETQAEPIEASEEAVRLCEELGLEGQSEFAKVDGDEMTRRNPYRKMTADELYAYQTLCPQEYLLEDYSNSPIPLRVLETIAYAKQFFEVIQIWDKASAEVKDPVVVGFVNEGDKWSKSKAMIIARWGEVLETPSVLFKQAIKANKARLIEEAKVAVAESKAALERINAMSDPKIADLGTNGISLSTPYWR